MMCAMATSPSMLDRFRTFASTPEGRRVYQEARRLAKDPTLQRRIDATRRDLVGTTGAAKPSA